MQEIVVGDCVEKLKELPDNCIDAIVTDPPYGLEFMGKDWDAPWKHTSGGFSAPGIGDRATSWPSFKGSNLSRCAACGLLVGQGGSPCRCETPQPVRQDAERMRAFQAWCETWAREALRVLKPGGHLLSFGGTRTYHRMACAIEDAGFEIRDSIHWIYGVGFPKSLNVYKEIAKLAGGVSDDAKAWEGWGTAIKPAHEPIVLARKPLAGTVAANVLAHGTGALNIDGCRISTTENLNGGAYAKNGSDRHDGAENWRYKREGGTGEFTQPTGRWPANVIFTHSESCRLVGTRSVKANGTIGKDTAAATTARATANRSVYQPHDAERGERQPYGNGDGTETVEKWECADGCAVAELDRQSPVTGTPRFYAPQNRPSDSAGMFGLGARRGGGQVGDVGGASRFFYVSKPSTREREDGLDHLPKKQAGELVDREEGSPGTKSPRAGAGRSAKSFLRLRQDLTDEQINFVYEELIKAGVHVDG